MSILTSAASLLLGVSIICPVGAGGDIVIPGQKRVPHELVVAAPNLAGALGAHYEVQDGDSLSKIAARELGDESRWPEIQLWNRLSAPDQLRPGSHLVLPSLPPANLPEGQTSWVLFAVADLPMGGLPTPLAAGRAVPSGRYQALLIAVPRLRLSEFQALVTSKERRSANLSELDWVAKSGQLPGHGGAKDSDPIARMVTHYDVESVLGREISVRISQTLRLGKDGEALGSTPGLSGTPVGLVALSSLCLLGGLGLALIARRRSGLAQLAA